MTTFVTPLYAALAALLFLVLSWQVIAYRRTNRLSLGDEGDKGLLKRMRAQANFAEYVPLALFLMLCLELQSIAIGWVHLTGTLLLIGRALHAYGFSARPPIIKFRVYGMILTLASYGVLIVLNIFCVLF